MRRRNTDRYLDLITYDVLDRRAAGCPWLFRWVVQIFGPGYAAHYLLLMELFGLCLVVLLLTMSCGKSSCLRCEV